MALKKCSAKKGLGSWKPIRSKPWFRKIIKYAPNVKLSNNRKRHSQRPKKICKEIKMRPYLGPVTFDSKRFAVRYHWHPCQDECHDLKLQDSPTVYETGHSHGERSYTHPRKASPHKAHTPYSSELSQPDTPMDGSPTNPGFNQGPMQTQNQQAPPTVPLASPRPHSSRLVMQLMVNTKERERDALTMGIIRLFLFPPWAEMELIGIELPLRLLEKMVKSSGNFADWSLFIFYYGVIIKQYLENILIHTTSTVPELGY
jgi:hypothetical protein